MQDVPSFESITAETTRLTTAFLHRELELTATMLELARIEVNTDDERGASQAMNFARQGIATIHRYLHRIPAQDQELVLQQLALLEHQMELLRTSHAHMVKATSRATPYLSKG